MEKNKSNDYTKKLRNLVKDRKISVVVTKQGTTKKVTHPSGVSSESYSMYNCN